MANNHVKKRKKVLTGVISLLAISACVAVIFVSIAPRISLGQTSKGGLLCFNKTCLSKWPGKFITVLDMNDKDGDWIYNYEEYPSCLEKPDTTTGVDDAETLDKRKAHEGCPDSDGDTFFDNKDACPDSSAPLSDTEANGCPSPKGRDFTIQFTKVNGTPITPTIDANINEDDTVTISWEIKMPTLKEQDFGKYTLLLNDGSVSSVLKDHTITGTKDIKIGSTASFSMKVSAPGVNFESRTLIATASPVNGGWNTPVCPIKCGTSKVTRTCDKPTPSVSGTGCKTQSDSFTRGSEEISCEGTGMGTPDCVLYPTFNDAYNNVYFDMIDWHHIAGGLGAQHYCYARPNFERINNADYIVEEIGGTVEHETDCTGLPCQFRFTESCEFYQDVEVYAYNLRQSPYAVTQLTLEMRPPLISKEQEPCLYDNETNTYPICKNGDSVSRTFNNELQTSAQTSCIGTSMQGVSCLYPDGKFCLRPGATSYTRLHCQPAVIRKAIKHYYTDKRPNGAPKRY